MTGSFAWSVGVALVMFAASASAAELPSRKTPPPAATVKTCEIDGKEGFRLPDSDVCMKISGYVSGQVTAGTLQK
jgi:hypothetical protein